MRPTTATFDGAPRSVGKARDFLRHQLSAIACPKATVEDASLLVSELATNAVVHAGTPFSVSVSYDDATLTVEVADTGRGRPNPPLSPLPSRRPWAGRGLQMVEQVAEKWGVREEPEGKAVYFTLPR